MARALARRVDKVAASVHCPNCGCKLRGHGRVRFEEEEKDDEYRRMLADATNEDLEAIHQAMERIKARHIAACAARGETPSIDSSRPPI
jgi:hypothetical protein